MPDRIEKLGHSVIQHGKANDRIYLMKLARCDLPHIQKDLELLAEKKEYGKIFCKVPAWARKPFERSEYQEEAEIPNYYQGRTDLLFYSLFRKKERHYRDPERKNRVEEILKNVQKNQDEAPLSIPNPLEIRSLSESDLKTLADLYKKVFDSYPFPIFDPNYLRETMQSHVEYFGAFESGELVAVSSAEMDKTAYSVEMTDFATLPDFRGRGLATQLLLTMEEAMKERGMVTAYTIARAISGGMNMVFARSGYSYSGTLVNNTQIAGTIESMNVWFKPLRSL